MSRVRETKKNVWGSRVKDPGCGTFSAGYEDLAAKTSKPSFEIVDPGLAEIHTRSAEFC
jgi:hypothetical protein